MPHPFFDHSEPFSLCPLDPGALDLLRRPLRPAPAQLHQPPLQRRLRRDLRHRQGALRRGLPRARHRPGLSRLPARAARPRRRPRPDDPVLGRHPGLIPRAARPGAARRGDPRVGLRGRPPLRQAPGAAGGGRPRGLPLPRHHELEQLRRPAGQRRRQPRRGRAGRRRARRQRLPDHRLGRLRPPAAAAGELAAAGRRRRLRLEPAGGRGPRLPALARAGGSARRRRPRRRHGRGAGGSRQRLPGGRGHADERLGPLQAGHLRPPQPGGRRSRRS